VSWIAASAPNVETCNRLMLLANGRQAVVAGAFGRISVTYDDGKSIDAQGRRPFQMLNNAKGRRSH
jgi:hypothetical protein